MIVVSDTSCISNLLSVRKESLLVRLFGEVLIPPAVEQELLRFHTGLPLFLKCAVPTDIGRHRIISNTDVLSAMSRSDIPRIERSRP